MTIVEKLPRTIQIALTDNISNITKSVSDDLIFLTELNSEWRENPFYPIILPKVLNNEDEEILFAPIDNKWRYKLKPIPNNENFVDTGENEVFKFYYDERLYDPYLISKNLDEAYLLYNDVKKYRKKVIDILKEVEELKLNIELRNNIEKHSEREIEIRKTQLNGMAYAESTVRTIYGSNTYKDEERIQFEIDYILDIKKINRNHENQLYTKYLDYNSVLSKVADLERFHVEYMHNLIELIMCCQSIKHGLLLTYGIRPFVNKEILDSINNADDLFLSTIEELCLDDITKFQHSYFNFEDYFRDFLWKVTDELKIIKKSTYQTIESKSFSLLSLLEEDNLTDQTNPGFSSPVRGNVDPYTPEELRQINALKKGELMFTYTDDKDFITRIKGIFIEFNLRTHKLNVPSHHIGKTKRPYYDSQPLQYLRDYRFQDSFINMTITPPESCRKNKKFSFDAPVVKTIESAFLKGIRPPFYGQNVIGNLNPIGKWKIKIGEGVLGAVAHDLIEQVTIHYHIEKFTI